MTLLITVNIFRVFLCVFNYINTWMLLPSKYSYPVSPVTSVTGWLNYWPRSLGKRVNITDLNEDQTQGFGRYNVTHQTHARWLQLHVSYVY